MKIHDNGFIPKAGESYWAAAFSYNSSEPIIAQVTFVGEAPYLELKANGNYHSEWWLLEKLELPNVEVVRSDMREIISVCLAKVPASRWDPGKAIEAMFG